MKEGMDWFKEEIKEVRSFRVVIARSAIFFARSAIFFARIAIFCFVMLILWTINEILCRKPTTLRPKQTCHSALKHDLACQSKIQHVGAWPEYDLACRSLIWHTEACNSSTLRQVCHECWVEKCFCQFRWFKQILSWGNFVISCLFPQLRTRLAWVS